MTYGSWVITLYVLGAAVALIGALIDTGWVVALGCVILTGSLFVALAAMNRPPPTDPDEPERRWP